MFPILTVTMGVPASGFCDPETCWKRPLNGFSYTNAAATPDGVRQMTLQASGHTGSYIAVSGRGSNLRMPVSTDGIFR